MDRCRGIEKWQRGNNWQRKWIHGICIYKDDSERAWSESATSSDSYLDEVSSIRAMPFETAEFCAPTCRSEEQMRTTCEFSNVLSRRNKSAFKCVVKVSLTLMITVSARTLNCVKGGWHIVASDPDVWGGTRRTAASLVTSRAYKLGPKKVSISESLKSIPLCSLKKQIYSLIMSKGEREDPQIIPVRKMFIK